VASSKNEVAAVEKDLASFKAAMTPGSAAAELVTNPCIPRAEKFKAVEALMEKAKYSDSTKQFFLTIADNGRLNELGNIMGKFEEIQRAAKGEIHAEVTVADALTAAQQAALEKSLNSFITKGQKLSIEVNVKPEILGGLVVNIGDKHVNMSILARIQQLQNLINQPIAL